MLPKCPSCGSTDGYYGKYIMYYTQYYYAEGDVDHYSETKFSGGTRKYCTNCDRDVTKHVNENRKRARSERIQRQLAAHETEKGA